MVSIDFRVPGLLLLQRNGIALCFGCPRMKFLSVPHKGDERGSFAWQHTVKGRGGGRDVIFVTDMVSWVPPAKRCWVAFKSLSVQMLPITSDQCPAI